MIRRRDVAAFGMAGVFGGMAGRHAALAQARPSHPAVLMVTGTPTGTWFPTGAAIAELGNQFYSGQPISVQPGAGAIGNVLSVSTGRSEMGFSYGAFLRLARQGGNDLFRGPPMPQLRAVMALAVNYFHIVRAHNAAFQSLAELKAARPRLYITTGVPGSTEAFVLERTLEFHGVSFNDIRDWGGSVVRGSVGERADDWTNGKTDLMATFFEPPNAQVANLLSTRAGSFVPLPDALRQSMVDRFGFADLTLAANAYPGQAAPVPTVGGPYVLFTTDKASEELVYNIVRGVAENPGRLAQAAAVYARAWRAEDMPRHVGIDLHPGALRYYRERGWAT